MLLEPRVPRHSNAIRKGAPCGGGSTAELSARVLAHNLRFGEKDIVIYGVALLAACFLTGMFLGDLLGLVVGVEANVGGVGIAMLLLILVSDTLIKQGHLKPVTRQGVVFWSAIYIPVIVAMAARQNVVGALDGGPMALIAGAVSVVACFLLVPAISRIGEPGEPLPELDEEAQG